MRRPLSYERHRMPRHDFRSPRLFVDAPLAAGAGVPLDRDQANYLGNVLRLGSGASVLAFNGRDGEWQAEIAGRKRPETLRMVRQTREQDQLGDVSYVFAMLKHGRLDYIVQKAVEMGASKLQPVTTRFTQVSRVNLERMSANVIASRASSDGRATSPLLDCSSARSSRTSPPTASPCPPATPAASAPPDCSPRPAASWPPCPPG